MALIKENIVILFTQENKSKFNVIKALNFLDEEWNELAWGDFILSGDADIMYYDKANNFFIYGTMEDIKSVDNKDLEYIQIEYINEIKETNVTYLDIIDTIKNFIFPVHPLQEIIDFFSHQGKIDPRKAYFDGDWFHYHSKEYPELEGAIFVVEKVNVEKNFVSVSIKTLLSGKEITDYYTEDKSLDFGFSTDTVIDIKVTKHGYYRHLEITHDLTDETVVQSLSYEDAGE